MRHGRHVASRRRFGALSLMLSFALVVAVFAIGPLAGAVTVNAVFDSSTPTLYPTGGSVSDVVATPDDEKFLQMGPDSSITMMFPGSDYAMPDGTGAADLRVDTYDVPYPAYAEVFTSFDGSAFTSMGFFADTANIDLDLVGPVKYVKIVQPEDCAPSVLPISWPWGVKCIDGGFPTLGFDLDAVVALNAGPLPSGLILSPANGSTLDLGDPLVLEADYYDDDPGSAVYWAVRVDENTPCSNTGSNQYWANVDGDSDPYTWTAFAGGRKFESTAPTTGWPAGDYCFVFNPGAGDPGESVQIRLISRFTLAEPPNTPPVADPNGPYTGTFSNPVSLVGSASYDPDGDTMTFLWDFGDGNSSTEVNPAHTYAFEGTHTVTLTVTDEHGASDTASTTAVIGFNPYTTAEDCVGIEFFVPSNPMLPVTTAPLTAGHLHTITARGTYYAGGVGTFDIQADAEYSQDRYQRTNGLGWTALVNNYEATDTGLLDLWLGIGGTPTMVDWGAYSSAHTYTKTVLGSGASAKFEFQVYDTYPTNNVGGLCVSVEMINRPPTVLSAASDANGNEGDTLNSGGSFTDLDGDTLTITADNAVGTFTDNGGGSWSWSYTTTDNGGGTITVSASDGHGGIATDSFDYSAANVAPTVGPITGAPIAPIPVGTTVNLSAVFTDPGTADTHEQTWDWGDGAGPTTSPAMSSLKFASVGVFPQSVTVAVEDDDDGIGTATLDFQVVVYDPSAGFVTGGGWFYSAPGEYVDNPDAEGKASFGFVAKYKKGANVPDGNTQFQFKAGDLNFHSSSYDWLVVTGSNHALFKGTGTINGEGEHKFMIWAGDDSPDTFHIKIWDDGGPVIYDNGEDQELGGGSIVIHQK